MHHIQRILSIEITFHRAGLVGAAESRDTELRANITEVALT